MLQWSKLVNVGMDRTVGSLLTASRCFLREAEELRQQIDSDFRKLLEGESMQPECASVVKQLKQNLKKMVFDIAIRKNNTHDEIRQKIVKEAEELIVEALRTRLVKVLFKDMIPSRLHEFEQALFRDQAKGVKHRGSMVLSRALSRTKVHPAPAVGYESDTQAGMDRRPWSPEASELVSLPSRSRPSILSVHAHSKSAMEGAGANKDNSDEDGDAELVEPSELGGAAEEIEEDADGDPSAMSQESNIKKGTRDQNAVQPILAELVMLVHEVLGINAKLAAEKLNKEARVAIPKKQGIQHRIVDMTRPIAQQWATTTAELVLDVIGKRSGRKPNQVASLTLTKKDVEELDRLLNGVEVLLDKARHSFSKNLLQSIQDSIVSVVLKETSKFSRPMKTLVKRFETFQDRLVKLLAEDDEQIGSKGSRLSTLTDLYAKGDQLSNRLRSTAQSRSARMALSMGSDYDVYLGGSAFSLGSIIRSVLPHLNPAIVPIFLTLSCNRLTVASLVTHSALRTSQRELRRDINELTYLSRKLDNVEGYSISNDTWRDYTEAWETLIGLRKDISAQRAQAIIRSIISDLRLMQGLGAASQLKKIEGEAPNEVLLLLNQVCTTLF